MSGDTEKGRETMVVVATNAWPTNAHMIADAAKLGYLDGHVWPAGFDAQAAGAVLV